MVNPVLSRIQGQREVLDVVPVNVVVKLKEYVPAHSRKKSMRWSWVNPEAGNMFGTCDVARGRIFSHAKVRELQDFLPPTLTLRAVTNGDKTDSTDSSRSSAHQRSSNIEIVSASGLITRISANSST